MSKKGVKAGVFKEFLALLLVISCARGRVYERPRATGDADPDVIAYTSDKQEDEEKVDAEDYSLPQFSDQKREDSKHHRVFSTFTEKNDDRSKPLTETNTCPREICEFINKLPQSEPNRLRQTACSWTYARQCCWDPSNYQAPSEDGTCIYCEDNSL